ncbi:RNA polymerase sigma factor [Micromonospora chaiyaphumensis]|uniref:RNA polymerase sigma-70 factor, ECF subfamily n=1 Tax=Micromonospora chaiyaphumensis TaxID=307119 RepID=A0A1C4WCA9_9ACTN|nr:RNA polymerase sigma factor [Micromonospora chaiyaphumensis]SCE93759.1 RNA polymerase sigma-70 factor, ECF subfamily [Micromonospora chaiyaphumensis]
MSDGDRFVGDLRQIAVDPIAFRGYYRAHFNAVQNYLARRVPDTERVADLTADVFLAAIAAAPRYRASRGTPLGWTYGIARNVLIADLRRSERERRAVDRVAGRRQLSDDDIARLEERIDAQAAVRRMMPTLGELTEGERAVLEFVAIEGLTIHEAAAALRISTVAARVRLHRARRRLGRQETSNELVPQLILEALQ